MKNKRNRNPIPKTLRGKKRYLVCRFFSSNSLEPKTVFSSLNELFLSLFGSVGMAKQRIVWREFIPKKGLLVVQCAAEQEKSMVLGLVSVQKIGSQAVVPSVVFKSGILQKTLDQLVETKNVA